MSLADIYSEVNDTFESDEPRFIELLKEHIDWSKIIPASFYDAYYLDNGRPRDFEISSMIKFFVLKKIFGVDHDRLFINILRYSQELRKYCGFIRVPDAAQVSRFRIKFKDHIQGLLDALVDITEPICREMSAELAACIAVDTTGVESYVKENNPKFFNTKLRQVKAMSKGKPEADPYKLVYGFLPETSARNPAVKQQYINGHFCYAQKFGIITNGLGIVRGVYQLGKDFKEAHPEMVVEKRSDNPDIDKEISDSHALVPILNDHFAAHPDAHYDTIMGDAGFDGYENFSSLLSKEFGFKRALIPMNPRNSSTAHKEINADGIPVCPVSREPMKCLGKSGGKNRSDRIKFVCPKSVVKNSKRICKCEHPCTTSTYGRTTYVYPDANKRLYPGILRNSNKWCELYKHRMAIERTIGYFKNDLSVAGHRTSHADTTCADMLFAAIAQLTGVIIADKIHKRQFSRRIRHLLNIA
jgi:hypothetical protein